MQDQLPERNHPLCEGKCHLHLFRINVTVFIHMGFCQNASRSQKQFCFLELFGRHRSRSLACFALANSFCKIRALGRLQQLFCERTRRSGKCLCTCWRMWMPLSLRTPHFGERLQILFMKCGLYKKLCCHSSVAHFCILF